MLMPNLSALEAYFNKSIKIARYNAPHNVPVIRELKTISLSHAAGRITESAAANRMRDALIRYGKDPSLLDGCYFEASHIKRASFDSSEFLSGVARTGKPQSAIKRESSSRASVTNTLQGVGAAFAKNLAAKPLTLATATPKRTAFKMANFGNGFIIKPVVFNERREAKQPRRHAGIKFDIPTFKMPGVRK